MRATIGVAMVEHPFGGAPAPSPATARVDSLTDECALHELIGCIICNPQPEASRQPDGHGFVASFDTQCAECAGPIRKGKHRVITRPIEWGRLFLHEECARGSFRAA